jgi:hypothetical protein
VVAANQSADSAEEASMDDDRREKKLEQLEEHSLPGTNMAGKGPADECDSHAADEVSRSDGKELKPAKDRPA